MMELNIKAKPVELFSEQTETGFQVLTNGIK